MIAINKQPYICSLSKNSIDFEVQTNMYYKSAFAYPSITLTMVALPLIGEHFAIQWFDPETGELQEVRLVAVDATLSTTYNRIYEIPDTAYSGTLNEFRDILLDKLQATPLLNGAFVIEAAGSTEITITATEAREELIPQWITNQASTRISTVIESDFVLPDTRDGYDMLALVYFEKEYLSGSFEMVASLHCVIDTDSKAILDISDVLNAEIESSWSEYPVPYTKANVYIAPNLKRYYVKFIETWTNESESNVIVSDTQFVHWGGVSSDDQMMADPITLLTNTNNFLTWWPSGKRIGKTQDDWLGWMNQGDEATYQIRVTLKTETGDHSFTVGSCTLKPFETVIFNSGYSTFDLESFVPGETIASWSFEIKLSGGGVVSPSFTYYLDTACIRKVILGFNSFGIPETFHTSGEWEESMKVSTSIATRSSVFGLNALFPQSFVFNSKHQNSIQALTGLLKQEEAFRLQSMINSMIAYVLDVNRWVPIVMNTSSTSVKRLNQFLTQIELEIIKANENDRASFFPLQPDISIHRGIGIDYIEVIDNNLEISAYGDFEAYLDGVSVETFTWNALTERYEPGAAITTEGEYRFVGTVTANGETINITKHFKYVWDELVISYYGTGFFDFAIRGTGLNAVNVDWGDGVTNQTLYSGTITSVGHTYTKTGKKVIRISKPDFSDVLEFNTNFNIGKIDYSIFSNIQKVSNYNGAAGNYYLSNLSKITHVTFNTTPISTLEIGLQKDLTILTLSDTLITSAALDAFVYELWTFRKLYNGTPALYFVNLGYTQSSYFDSIMDGTGEFAGEGLVANYGFTVTIV